MAGVHRRWSLPILLAALPTLAACEFVGPRAVRVGRPRYNMAVQYTEDQMMLLNIVRLRYNERLYFMDISGIYAAPNVGAGIEGGTSFGTSNFADFSSIRGELSYGESPVIIYLPLTGELFTRRLLTPLDADTLVLLWNVGWNTDRVMRTCVQRINGVRNAESASGPAQVDPPDYEMFRRISATLETIEERGLSRSGYFDEDGDGEVELHVAFEDEARELPEVRQLFEDLRLDPEASSYILTPSIDQSGGRYIAILTRPLMGTMYFLSKGVEVPPRDIEQGTVAVTLNEDGTPFDWSNVTSDLIRIRHADREPDDAYVSVEYRDGWFYIADDDVESKETFVLLSVLFTIQAGERPAGGPLLSLPVG